MIIVLIFVVLFIAALGYTIYDEDFLPVMGLAAIPMMMVVIGAIGIKFSEDNKFNDLFIEREGIIAQLKNTESSSEWIEKAIEFNDDILVNKKGLDSIWTNWFISSAYEKIELIPLEISLK